MSQCIEQILFVFFRRGAHESSFDAATNGQEATIAENLSREGRFLGEQQRKMPSK